MQTSVETQGTFFKSTNGGPYSVTTLDSFKVSFGTVVKPVDVAGYEKAIQFSDPDGNVDIYAFKFSAAVGDYKYYQKNWQCRDRSSGTG